MNLKTSVLPLVVFILIVGFLLAGLNRDPGLVPSPFVDKATPQFKTTSLFDKATIISNEALDGEIWLINIWASWCVVCLEEHPLLVELGERESEGEQLNILGLNYKDKATDAMDWLAKYGNPYKLVAVDEAGEIGINFGVYGVPETFIVDKNGIIRYKHIGPLTREIFEIVIKPIIDGFEVDGLEIDGLEGKS